MKVKIKIEKLAGETGLRMPGSILLMDKQKAKELEIRGIVSMITRKRKVKK